MKTTADGLVIWETKTGEADRVVTLLTPNGVITAYAKNSLRPKNRLTSTTAMLSYSNFELYSGKNMYTIDDAQSIKRFVRLASDVEAYALAVYFCELLKLLAPVEEDARDFLTLALNSLYLLNERKKSLPLIKAVFELRSMAYAGYLPDLSGCARCGAPEPQSLRFDLAGGAYLCAECAKALSLQPNCSRAVLHAMRYLLGGELNRAFSFELGADGLKLLGELSEQYVLAHIERGLSTLDFYNALKL